MPDRLRKTRPPPPDRVTFRVAVPKPRNPFVVAALRRSAGAHRRSEPARRAADRQAVSHPLDDD